MSPVYYAKQYNCLLLNCATIVDIGLTFISFSLRLIKLSLIIRAAGLLQRFLNLYTRGNQKYKFYLYNFTCHITCF